LRDRKLQRALMQFFKPENYFAVREALIQAGRRDLIGSDCDSLIPANPPKEAIEARRKAAGRQFRGDYVHRPTSEDASPSDGRPTGKRRQSRRPPGKGYRPKGT
jgi:Domain of unknown function (DUF3362)